MKKKLFALLLAVTLFATPVFSEPLCRVETESDGNAEILGYDIIEQNGKKMLLILLNYENTTEESASPGWEISVKAFDNGIALEHAYASDIPGYDNYYQKLTEIRPGGTLPYYELFEAPKSDNVEVEVDALIAYKSTPAVISLDMTKLGLVSSEEDTVEADVSSELSETEQSSEDNKDLKEHIAELEQKIADLETRIEALENN